MFRKTFLIFNLKINLSFKLGFAILPVRLLILVEIPHGKLLETKLELVVAVLEMRLMEMSMTREQLSLKDLFEQHSVNGKSEHFYTWQIKVT